MARFSDGDIQKIIIGDRVVAPVQFPGRDSVTVGVRGLSDDEIDAARVEAQGYVESLCKRADMRYEVFVSVDPESYDRELQRQIIARAYVDIEAQERPFFDAAVQVRRLGSVTIARLWEVYTGHQEAVNPRRMLSETQVKELVDALGKEPSATVVLEDFERDTLCSLVRFLASELQTSRTGS